MGLKRNLQTWRGPRGGRARGFRAGARPVRAPTRDPPRNTGLLRFSCGEGGGVAFPRYDRCAAGAVPQPAEVRQRRNVFGRA